MDVHSLNPYIRVAMHSILKGGTVIGKRVLYDYELVYLEKGEFSFFYNGISYAMKEGQFFLIRPNMLHRFDCTKQSISQPHIHFDLRYSINSKKTPVSFKKRENMTEEEQNLIQEDLFSMYPPIPLIRFSDHNRALSLFYQAINAFMAHRVLEAKGTFTALLGLLIEDNFPAFFAQDLSVSHSITRQIKDFLDSGQGHEIHLDDLSKQFSYSKYYLEKQFKKDFGISIMAYRNQKRMEAACQQLKSEQVSAVAEHLGFSSIYAFSRAFKQVFGISPSQFKKQNK